MCWHGIDQSFDPLTPTVFTEKILNDLGLVPSILGALYFVQPGGWPLLVLQYGILAGLL